MDQVGQRHGLLSLAEHSRSLCSKWGGWEYRQWLIILSRPRGMLTSGEHFISWLALACDWAISSSDGKPAKPVERWVPLSRDRCVTVANWQSCKSAPLKRYLNRLTVSRWSCIHDYFFLPLSPFLILSFLRYTDRFISPPCWRCIINARQPLFVFTLICCLHAYSFQTLWRFMALLRKLLYDVINSFCTQYTAQLALLQNLVRLLLPTGNDKF